MAVGTGYRTEGRSRTGRDGEAQSPSNLLVDERYAAVLAEDFGIPLTDVEDALIGQPKARAIGVCEWASGEGKAPIKKGQALTGWAKKHKAGRYAARGGRTGGPVRVPARRTRESEREKFSAEQVMANLDRMGG